MKVLVNWLDEVIKRKDVLLDDLKGLLRIESIKDLSSKTETSPMGRNVAEALDFMLDLSENSGFNTKNLDGYAGYLEYKNNEQSDEYVGVLCHVDVVPATGVWTTPPFEPTIREGKLFARGAIDDKGPTMAAFYGLKIVKELGLPLKNNVRIIFGTDEESGMSCMKHYQDVEKMPALGFAPDAVFPMINAEKGQLNIKLSLKDEQKNEDAPLRVVSFKSGSRVNMVPESATVILEGEFEALAQNFEVFCHENQLRYEHNVHGNQLELTLFGVSAHGMEPHKGQNAGTTLAQFLSNYSFKDSANPFFSLLALLHEDFNGVKLGVEFSDSITGPLTVNPGILSYEQDGEGTVYLNVRCPVTTDYEETKKKLIKKIEGTGFVVAEIRESQPHHVDAEEPMIKILQKVYQEETNQEPTLLSTGGATYAKFMEKGVAFGACFPGKEMTAHQKDEYIEIDDLLKATAIYARAIYELGNLEL
ncbi:dipeptidase PepV [Neobacillus sp. D3-1R]|uniref:dipeptidase PepV n=1 Tax=Neobacillus sp. D3-1R TaxID=3445778 RepID=UPI003F9FF00E